MSDIDNQRRICPVHEIPDCSPILNGCPRLTADPDVILCWEQVPCTALEDHRCTRPHGHDGSHRCRRWSGGMKRRTTLHGLADLCS